jgi:hypothetical protein
MGKHIEYSTEKELDEAIAKRMQDDPHGLSISDHVKVAGVFVIRMDDDETTLPGKGDPVALKKVPLEMKALMRSKADFVLVVDYHFWQTAPELTKQGYLGRAIQRIKVEKTEDGVKIGTRKWDIVENISTIKTYGLYTENLALMGETVGALPKQLQMAMSAMEKEKAKAAKSKPEPPEDDAEPPRVVARPVKKGKVVEEESEEPTRPPRRVPPDPEPGEEKEPEPED